MHLYNVYKVCTLTMMPDTCWVGTAHCNMDRYWIILWNTTSDCYFALRFVKISLIQQPWMRWLNNAIRVKFSSRWSLNSRVYQKPSFYPTSRGLEFNAFHGKNMLLCVKVPRAISSTPLDYTFFILFFPINVHFPCRMQKLDRIFHNSDSEWKIEPAVGGSKSLWSFKPMGKGCVPS